MKDHKKVKLSYLLQGQPRKFCFSNKLEEIEFITDLLYQHKNVTYNNRLAKNNKTKQILMIAHRDILLEVQKFEIDINRSKKNMNIIMKII
jgi:hypothetical protein